jgi:hypothetical protein
MLTGVWFACDGWVCVRYKCYCVILKKHKWHSEVSTAIGSLVGGVESKMQESRFGPHCLRWESVGGSVHSLQTSSHLQADCITVKSTALQMEVPGTPPDLPVGPPCPYGTSHPVHSLYVLCTLSSDAFKRRRTSYGGLRDVSGGAAYFPSLQHIGTRVKYMVFNFFCILI